MAHRHGLRMDDGSRRSRRRRAGSGEHPSQQDVWAVHPEGTGEMRLTTTGVAPTWQADPRRRIPPSPAPSVSPTPEPEGRDIGLAFNLCHVERLDGSTSLVGHETGQRGRRDDEGRRRFPSISNPTSPSLGRRCRRRRVMRGVERPPVGMQCPVRAARRNRPRRERTEELIVASYSRSWTTT